MQNLAQTMSNQQSYSMIGKTVEGRTFLESEGKYMDIKGRVDSVVVRAGQTFLKVGSYEISLKDVDQVFEDEYQMMVWHSINNNILNNQNLALVGKYIQAITVENGQAKEYVEGQVMSIRFIDGRPLLVVQDSKGNSKEIYTEEVISIAGGLQLVGKNAVIHAFDNSLTPPGYRDVSGTISGIRIYGGRAFVQIGGLEAQVDKIDILTEALRSVGTNVTLYKDNVSQDIRAQGPISQVVVREGKIFVRIGGGTENIPYEDVRTLL
jgi:hypothetical protein